MRGNKFEVGRITNLGGKTPNKSETENQDQQEERSIGFLPVNKETSGEKLDKIGFSPPKEDVSSNEDGVFEDKIKE